MLKNFSADFCAPDSDNTGCQISDFRDFYK